MGFNRIVKLIIVNKEGTAIEVSNLRTTFNIDKTSGSEPNSAEISVYNMNPTSTAFLQQNDLKIALFCGYKQRGKDLRLIFEGEVLDAMSAKSGSDKIITMICGDANTGINLNHYEKTYSPGTPIKVIITDIAKSMNVVISEENIEDIPTDKFISSYIALGSTKDILDDLFKKLDLEWYVQNNVFYAKKRIDIKSTNAILISSETGMIGSPIRKKEKDVKFGEVESGVTFNSVLNADLNVGSTVKIESKFADIDTLGLYVIKEIKVTGDTHSSNWYSKCLCLGEKTRA